MAKKREIREKIYTEGIAILEKTNINIKERARPKTCKTKEQDLQLVTFQRNEFLQRSISSIFAEKSFL